MTKDNQENEEWIEFLTSEGTRSEYRWRGALPEVGGRVTMPSGNVYTVTGSTTITSRHSGEQIPQYAVTRVGRLGRAGDDPDDPDVIDLYDH